MPSSPRLLVGLALSLWFVGGCSFDSINRPAEGSGVLAGTLISASVQVPVAAPGEEVSVRFINMSDRLYSVNTCLRKVERLEGATWVLIPEELRLCAPGAAVIPALAEAYQTADVPVGLEAGSFRFRFSMTQPTGPAVDITTPAFRVE